jgi:nucleotide-binding universal stress UspA family protein
MKTPEIKRILIPTDFSETGLLAMEHAVFMARLLKAHLFLLYVVEAFEYSYSIYEPEVLIQDNEEVHDIAKEKIERLAVGISKENGINVTALVGSGRPASGIADAVKESHIDLVIMGTHGAKGFEEYFIGSNAHKVVNMGICPVITIQQSAKKKGFTNIVMPIDDSLYSRQKTSHVIRIASIFDAKVHILGLWEGEQEIEEKKFNIKLDSVENALKKADIRYDRKTIKSSHIADEAMKYSEEVGADLIVIMTDHESALKGNFLSGQAKQIVNHSRIPVMSIKPLLEGHFDEPGLSAASPLF